MYTIQNDIFRAMCTKNDWFLNTGGSKHVGTTHLSVPNPQDSASRGPAKSQTSCVNLNVRLTRKTRFVKTDWTFDIPWAVQNLLKDLILVVFQFHHTLMIMVGI